MYRLNNKYTAGGSKAIQGILYVEENSSVCYLDREWEYYPNVLLTPDLLKRKKGDYYCRYISIGEYGGMDLGEKNRSPFGSGTYRLTVVLPEEEKIYGISLTEVFSAYRLYIDGKLVGQVGNPDPDHYVEEIQNRVFTFRGKGTVEIMIAVTDKSSVSSGIQYVPMFGTPLQLNLIRGVTVLVDAVFLALGIFVLSFCVYMFWKTKKVELAYFCIICICVLGYTCYPLVHAFIPVKAQPWYGIESLFYYLMFAGIILLQQRILEEEDKKTELAAGILAAAGAGVFITELLASGMQSAGGLYLVSQVTEGMKWLTAFYLIWKTIRRSSDRYFSVMLAGTVIYGCSLASDRIGRLYEPVVGGWFPEIGGAALVFCVGIILWKEIADAYRFRLTYSQYSRLMEQRLLMQQQHYEELSEKMQEISRMRHDMRHHLRILQAYVKEGRYKELEKYLAEYSAVAEQKDHTICYCSNMAVDAVVHYYAKILEQKNITFTCDMTIPRNTGISDMDLCRLFGNLLENAVEAVSAQNTADYPCIQLTVRMKNQKLLIEIVNTCRSSVVKKGERIYSTKHEGFGIGTASVTEVAHKYGGLADFRAEDGVFRVNIFLPLKIVQQKS